MRPGRGPLAAVLWAAEYEGPFRRLVHAFKFEGCDFLGRHLGTETARRLAGLLRTAAGAPPDAPGLPRPDLIAPVPLHVLRRWRRGYNQALLLARPIARCLGIPIVPGLLARRRAGRRQLGLSRRERLRDLEGCYATRRRPDLRGRTVLLVDDVTTTGATLEACARALLRGGAKTVIACVLARTPEKGGGIVRD